MGATAATQGNDNPAKRTTGHSFNKHWEQPKPEILPDKIPRMAPKQLGLRDSSLPPRLFLTFELPVQSGEVKNKKVSFLKEANQIPEFMKQTVESNTECSLFITFLPNMCNLGVPQSRLFFCTHSECSSTTENTLQCFYSASRSAPPFRHHPNLFLLQVTRSLYLPFFSFFSRSLVLSLHLSSPLPPRPCPPKPHLY